VFTVPFGVRALHTSAKFCHVLLKPFIPEGSSLSIITINMQSLHFQSMHLQSNVALESLSTIARVRVGRREFAIFSWLPPSNGWRVDLDSLGCSSSGSLQRFTGTDSNVVLIGSDGRCGFLYRFSPRFKQRIFVNYRFINYRFINYRFKQRIFVFINYRHAHMLSDGDNHPGASIDAAAAIYTATANGVG